MIGLFHALLVAGFLAPAGGGMAAWIAHAPQAPFPPGAVAGPVDRVLIDKSDRRMTLYRQGRAIKSYPVALGFAPEGAKAVQGDGRTPEGAFRIDRRNPRSAYHLSLGIDYPQSVHRAAARAAGASPGGDIFIHGQPNQLRGRPAIGRDWTAGCVAVSNAAIEEMWRVIAIGTVVEIRP